MDDESSNWIDAATQFYLDRFGQPAPRLRDHRPDFLFISPTKTGTTWLAKNLGRHPGIYIPPIKEVNYFNKFSCLFPLDWYLGHFEPAASRCKGDATPYAGLPLPAVRALGKLYPDLRLIFILREPVERAWSHLRHRVRFAERVFQPYGGRLADVPIQVLIEFACSVHMVDIGDYAACLSRWFSVFPTNQIHFEFFDAIATEPSALLNRVCRFLGVEPLSPWPEDSLRERVLEGTGEPPPPRAAAVLRRIYQPRTHSLEELLRREAGISLPSSWPRGCGVEDQSPVTILQDFRGFAIHLQNGLFYSSKAGAELPRPSPPNGQSAASMDIPPAPSLDEAKRQIEAHQSGEAYRSHEWTLFAEHKRQFRTFDHTGCSWLYNYSGFPVYLTSQGFWTTGPEYWRERHNSKAEAAAVRAAIDAGRAFFRKTVQDLQALIDDLLPVLVQEGYDGYNVIRFAKRYYGVSQKAGDFSLVDYFRCESEHKPDEWFEGDSPEAVLAAIKAIGPFVPELVAEGVRGFNLVAYRGRVFALAQSLGPIVLSDLDAAAIVEFERRGEIIAGATAEDVKHALNSRRS